MDIHYYLFVLMTATCLCVTSYPNHELETPEAIVGRLQDAREKEVSVQWPNTPCDYWTSIGLMDLSLTEKGEVCLTNTALPPCSGAVDNDDMSCTCVCWQLNGKVHRFRVCTDGQLLPHHIIRCIDHSPFQHCDNKLAKLETITLCRTNKEDGTRKCYSNDRPDVAIAKLSGTSCYCATVGEEMICMPSGCDA